MFKKIKRGEEEKTMSNIRYLHAETDIEILSGVNLLSKNHLKKGCRAVAM